ncbi:MAG: hypothetical protein IJ598_07040, partial [Ruminococcus sp.]|nr:hypothetical protein [Ruminococcus sp.]
YGIILLWQGDFLLAKTPVILVKQVKASRPLVGGLRRASDGRADRCAVLGEHTRRLLRESSAFAVFV